MKSELREFETADSPKTVKLWKHTSGCVYLETLDGLFVKLVSTNSCPVGCIAATDIDKTNFHRLKSATITFKCLY